MAFDLSSPAAALAFEMALRNRQTVEGASQFDKEARQAVQEALNYGNDKLADYENIYREYVGPAEASRRAQAEAFNTYLVGLPELIAQSARERAGSSGGGVSYDTTNLSNYESPAERLQRLMNTILPTGISRPLLPKTAPQTSQKVGQKISSRRLQ